MDGISQHPRAQSTGRPTIEFRQSGRHIGRPDYSAMQPHSFRHSGHLYEVRFTWAEQRWSAALHREDEQHGYPLLSLTDELARDLSDAAIRSGFIRLAEWLVQVGQWSDEGSPRPD
jgi:hypothetical protein